MYEDIYRIYTGENLKTEDWKISAEEFEKIMTTYFPVSVEQLREHRGYDEGSNSYEYEMIYASPYPPFLNDETVLEMQKRLMETGCPVSTLVTYSNMGNYESVDSYLENCTAGERGSVVVYEIHSDGGIGRIKYIYDGTDMYVVSAGSVWNKNGKSGMSYISYTRIKEWKYTDKGWFCYELCVPEPPEVTEIVDGSCLVRIKPLSKEQREMSERCVQGLGYQGNNLLCSNWDTDHMEKLDYNGIYEYLYAMKHQKAFDAEDYPNGIPKEEFESLIMEYLPVTAEQIQEYAVFDEKNQTYVWVRLGCLNYAPTFFGTSLPEVIDIKENEDGTVTLTVDMIVTFIIYKYSYPFLNSSHLNNYNKFFVLQHFAKIERIFLTYVSVKLIL